MVWVLRFYGKHTLRPLRIFSLCSLREKKFLAKNAEVRKGRKEYF